MTQFLRKVYILAALTTFLLAACGAGTQNKGAAISSRNVDFNERTREALNQGEDQGEEQKRLLKIYIDGANSNVRSGFGRLQEALYRSDNVVSKSQVMRALSFTIDQLGDLATHLRNFGWAFDDCYSVQNTLSRASDLMSQLQVGTGTTQQATVLVNQVKELVGNAQSNYRSISLP